MPQIQVTLNRLRRWYADPDTWPAWLAFITFHVNYPRPAEYAHDPNRIDRWVRSCARQPKLPEGCRYEQQYRFGVVGSPDILVMIVEHPCKCSLFLEKEVLVPTIKLIPC